MPIGFLVASPQMRDPHFERAVVLLCQHDEEGALGLIINRDGPITLGMVAEQMKLAAPASPQSPTWWGGPVGPGTGFVVWSGPGDEDEGWNPAPGIWVSLSSARLAELFGAGERFFLCLGYAGWGAGQLDAEIERGSWIVTDIDPAVLFEVPLPERYTRALALLGLSADTVWMTPIDE